MNGGVACHQWPMLQRATSPKCSQAETETTQTHVDCDRWNHSCKTRATSLTLLEPCCIMRSLLIVASRSTAQFCVVHSKQLRVPTKWFLGQGAQAVNPKHVALGYLCHRLSMQGCLDASLSCRSDTYTLLLPACRHVKTNRPLLWFAATCQTQRCHGHKASTHRVTAGKQQSCLHGALHTL